MINIIKTFITTDYGIKVLELIVTIIIAYVTAKITTKSTRKNLTTQYFKEKGIDIQEKVLRFWCTLVMNNFQIMEAYKESFGDKKLDNDTDILIDVQKESYIYCSSKTIKAISEYQDYLYNSNNSNSTKSESNQKKKEKTNIVSLVKNKTAFVTQFVLISRIISSMKYDFTGEKVNEIDLIKIRINDLDIFTKIYFKLVLCYFYVKERIELLLFIFFVVIIIFIFLK